MTEPNETPLKPQLLPCPFCGREPVVADIGHGDVFYRCPMDCTTGMSAEVWNRRADPAPASAEEHDPLCSIGQHAGDQTMPCDCYRLSAAEGETKPEREK